jgi:uncharacterized membrane protein YGL010W
MKRTKCSNQVGMQAISDQYNIIANNDGDHGPFEWKKRMGIHLAFHRDPMNIFIHSIFSLLNAWAVLLIAYPFAFFAVEISGVPLDMAMVILFVVFIIYARMEIFTALLVTAAYAATYPLCGPVMDWMDGSIIGMVALGTFLTFFSLAIQVFIGHGISEKGIDDAIDNFKELFKTKNPLYIALLPFYTYLDLMFMLGYRPKLASYVWAFTSELRPKVVLDHHENSKALQGK